jgi:general nucleoside transport system permease protein
MTAPPQRAPIPRRLPRPSVADHAISLGWHLASILVALSVAGLLVAITGSEPTTVVRTMIEGSIGSRASIVATLNHAAPILLVAAGTVIAAKAGLLNIGQEGQIIFGGMFAVAVGLSLDLPKPLLIPMMLLAAALGGGLWAGIAAVLRFWRGVNEVIGTLLLSFVAFQAVSYAVNQPWLLQEDVAEGSGLSASPQSNALPEAAHLPTLLTGPGYRLHLGIVIAVVIALVSAFLVMRTKWGLELTVVGLNDRAARRIGLSPILIGATALTLSGAFAGVAGGVLLGGTAFRVNSGFSSNYGWEGLLVGLIARSNPLSVIPFAFLYGALRAGGGVLASTGVSASIVGVVQALIVLAVALPSYFLRRRNARVATSRMEVAST